MSKILNNLNERQLMAALHFRNLADQSCAISSQTVFDPDEKIRGQGGAPHARALDHFHIVRRIGAIRKAVDNLGAFHVGSGRAPVSIGFIWLFSGVIIHDWSMREIARRAGYGDNIKSRAVVNGGFKLACERAANQIDAMQWVEA